MSADHPATRSFLRRGLGKIQGLGFNGLGCRGLGIRDFGFRDLGVRGLEFRGLGLGWTVLEFTL